MPMLISAWRRKPFLPRSMIHEYAPTPGGDSSASTASVERKGLPKIL